MAAMTANGTSETSQRDPVKSASRVRAVCGGHPQRTGVGPAAVIGRIEILHRSRLLLHGCVAPLGASLWVIMQGRRAFLFGSFPTADGHCRTGCCTPPHWFFAVSVFVSTGAATAPRWETIHVKLKNDRGSNRPVPDRACGRIAHQSRFDVGAGRGGLTRSGPRAGLR